MQQTIDILLATYNGEKFLEELLSSMMSQTFQDFHLIIRDDQSSDGTVQLIDAFLQRNPDKITLIKDTEHLGVCSSFARLLAASKAPYAMFADQDDIWLKDKVSRTLQKMNALESCHGKDKPLLVHSNLKVVDHNLKEISPSFWQYTRITPKEGSRLNRLIVQNEVTGCTMMLNTSLKKLVCPIPPESMMHDWWAALVAAAFGYIGLIQEPLILYRQHSSNTLGARNYRSLQRIWKKLKSCNSVKQATDQQAQALLTRFNSALSQRQQSLIRDYLSMGRRSFLMNKYLLFKHGFFKHGFHRNLLTFFNLI